MDKMQLGFTVSTVNLLSKSCDVLLPLFDKVSKCATNCFEPSLRQVCLNYIHMFFLIENSGLSE